MKNRQFRILSKKIENIKNNTTTSFLDKFHKCVTIAGTFVTIGFAILTMCLTKEYRNNNEQLRILKEDYRNSHLPFLQIDYELKTNRTKDTSWLLYRITNSGGHLHNLKFVPTPGFRDFRGIRKNFGSNSSFKGEIEFHKSQDKISGEYKFHYCDILNRKFEQILVMNKNKIANFNAEFGFPNQIDSCEISLKQIPTLQANKTY